MKFRIATLLGTLTLAACSSTPDPAQQATRGSDQSTHTSKSPASANANVSAPSTSQNQPVGAAARTSIPQERSVYFDYDSTAVKDEYRPVVNAHARYLAQQRRNSVRVEGNADERGSREYNLALGQRRAEAVKERLSLLGVPAERIEAVSFGEEKPRVDGETEAAYSQNRRADITYATR
jgi:peptidoglycan-associated lipoprotein